MSKESDKIYYEKNKDRISARIKLWKKVNPDKVRAQRKNSVVSKKEWSVKNVEKMREYRRKHYKKTTPEQKLSYRLKKHYGLSVEEFFSILEKQGNKCAVCLREPTKNRRLAVDHNHITGQIRGLLCFQCNSSIGLLNENIKTLENMIEYLKNNG